PIPERDRWNMTAAGQAHRNIERLACSGRIGSAVRPVGRQRAVVEAAGLLVRGTATVRLALAVEGRGATGGGAREARVDFQGLVEIGERAIVAALLEPDRAAVAVDL